MTTSVQKIECNERGASDMQSNPLTGTEAIMPSPGGNAYAPATQTQELGFITRQPNGTPAMSLNPVGGNRNVKNLPVKHEGRSWSYSLFGCFNECGICLVALCCPWSVHTRIEQRFEHLQHYNASDPENGGPFWTRACAAEALITSMGGGWVLHMLSRREMRQRYSIRGNELWDIFVSFLCGPCELTQEAREIGLEEESYRTQHH
ncbi:PLAC8 family-domain-containing protein [Crucibulum laeve]|uniref:PLAC8 family-domain-containing protein n=1 Tax=Crucibulum laeve TaxID=68775 RepID=A0A5C3LVN7_9AGAR|nr:PLAC8 family-domain-containing protein [Crucibulum laeve]